MQSSTKYLSNYSGGNISMLTLSCNSSNGTVQLQWNQASVNGWFAFTIAVCVFGTVSLLLLLTVALTKRLHHGAGFLIIHLSCLQLFLCAISYPFSTTDIYLALIPDQAVRFAIHCPSFLFIFKVTLHTEMWSSVLLAVNRCVAVALPHHYRMMTTKVALASMIGVAWVIALAVNIPLLFGVGLDLKRDHPVEYCLAMPNDSVYGRVYLVMERYLPLGVKGVMHFALFLHIHVKRIKGRKSVKPLVPSTGKVPSRNLQKPRTTTASKSAHAQRGGRNIVLAEILGVSFIWKCVCFLPGPISQEVYPALYSSSQILQFWMLRTFALCGYAANPIFFFALSSDYQTAVAQLL
ncbi:hypothetical protein BV898_13671 [Hypsibius exemplaris]|uniref:G-protein coupled receptors family 1 profile domain-containing protein n=1 Tax=Hypsibius exemplaris TaxID=2072580 RepID=A0A1W0W9Z3_HYPEX|nr:hypothetical protein BV898_13671 [Hypsibius exemplaris]